MSCNLSIVNIIPDQYRDAINSLAERYQLGPNNLSVKLLDISGNVYWGCQGMWTPDFYAKFTDSTARSEFISTHYTPEQAEIVNTALSHLYERLVLNGSPYDNWLAALSELNLTIADHLDVQGAI